MTEKLCLWLAKDNRCASCKARRIKSDVLKEADFEICHPEVDYGRCEFFKQKPAIGEK